MIRRPPRSTRTDTLFPYTTLFRSVVLIVVELAPRPDADRPSLARSPWPVGWPLRAPRKTSARRLACALRRYTTCRLPARVRSEEHTSELQSLMRISYAVFCLKKKKRHILQDLESKR